MQIPKKNLLKIQALKEHGDAVLIANKYGISAETVRRAFRTQSCSEELFRYLVEFYEERQTLLDAHISQ